MGGRRFVKSFYNKVAKGWKDPRCSAASPPPSSALWPPPRSVTETGETHKYPISAPPFQQGNCKGGKDAAGWGARAGNLGKKTSLIHYIGDRIYLQSHFSYMRRARGAKISAWSPASMRNKVSAGLRTTLKISFIWDFPKNFFTFYDSMKKLHFSTYILAASAATGCRPSGAKTCSSHHAAAFSPGLGFYLLVGTWLEVCCCGLFFFFHKASLILHLLGAR